MVRRLQIAECQRLPNLDRELPCQPSAPHLENEKYCHNVTSGLSGQGSSASSPAICFGEQVEAAISRMADIVSADWKIKATPSGRRYLRCSVALPTSDNGYMGCRLPSVPAQLLREPDGWLARQEQRKKDGKQTFAINGNSGEVHFWTAPEWLACRDGRQRHVNRSYPLANGFQPVDKLRAYGTRSASAASKFIQAVLKRKKNQ